MFCVSKIGIGQTPDGQADKMPQRIPLLEASLVVTVTNGFLEFRQGRLKRKLLDSRRTPLLDKDDVTSEALKRDRDVEFTGIDLQIDLAIGAESRTREIQFREQHSRGFPKTDLIRASNYQSVGTSSDDLHHISRDKIPTPFSARVCEASLTRTRVAAQDDCTVIP